jgi:DNA-binding NarL/FixJ family response regulator
VTGPGVLTPRELRVLRMVADGCRVGQIAARLGVAERTVSRNMVRICAKLGASDRANAVHLAWRARILP